MKSQTNCRWYRRLGWGAFVSLMLGGATTLGWADPQEPRAFDGLISKTVAELLPRKHLSRHALDAEISRRMQTLFLKAIDPGKMYFYQSDVNAFQQQQTELVEKARMGDVRPAYALYAVFLQRFDERIRVVDELLQQGKSASGFDFSAKESISMDRDAASWATDAGDVLERWRKQIKYELLSLKEDSEKPIQEQTACERIAHRYHSLARRVHETDAEELLEIYLNAMAQAYDSDTAYMSPRTVETLNMLMRLEFEGVDASFRAVGGYTTVEKLSLGGTAQEAGLKVQDKIIGVGQGLDGEIVDVVGKRLLDVLKMIHGKRGTVVRLQVLTHDGMENKVYTIARERVEAKDCSPRSTVFEQGRKPSGMPYKIGVIAVPSFYMDMKGAQMRVPDYRSISRDMKRILATMQSQHVDALVLDLRFNGGGSLTEAIHVAGLFLTDGPVVQLKDINGRVVVYDLKNSVAAWTEPMVVLTSKWSASASEIFAGAIQDYHRGLIVGDHTTFGNGTVQSLLNIDQELLSSINAGPSRFGVLKVTVAQFYRPSGQSTQMHGVAADLELPSVAAEFCEGEAGKQFAIPFGRVEPAQFQTQRYVNTAIIQGLATRSKTRVSQSPEFTKQRSRIARIIECKKGKTASLNAEEFCQDYARFIADQELTDSARRERFAIDRIHRDFYMNEVLAITQDYLEQLGRNGARSSTR